jgi:hypothetical protein
MVPTVKFPVGTPFTDQETVWSVLPVTLAENCTLSPARRVVLEGVMVMPFEVEFDPDPVALRPPPHPDHASMAKERTKTPANLTAEDLDVPIISDPLS